MSHFSGTPASDIYYMAATIAVICTILLVAAPASAAPTNTDSIDADTSTNTSAASGSDFPPLTANYVDHYIVRTTSTDPETNADEYNISYFINELKTTDRIKIATRDIKNDGFVVAINTNVQSPTIVTEDHGVASTTLAIYRPPESIEADIIITTASGTQPTDQEYTYGVNQTITTSVITPIS